MSTPVQICSNALLMLGCKPINSLAEDPTQATTDREQVAANLYPQVRDAVLRAHPWNCATKRVVLTPDSTTPVFGYSYQFLQPGDWLRTLGAYEGLTDCAIDYRHETNRFLADTTAFGLLYIWKNINPATWDTLLYDAVSNLMASRMAVSLTGDKALKVEMEKLYLSTMSSARAVDGQDTPPETFGDSPLLLSRLANG